MIVAIAVGACILASALAIVRVTRGPSLADRIIALDVGLMALMCGTTVFAVVRDAEELLVVPIIISIVGFTASVAVSRAIEQERGEP